MSCPFYLLLTLHLIGCGKNEKKNMQIFLGKVFIMQIKKGIGRLVGQLVGLSVGRSVSWNFSYNLRNNRIKLQTKKITTFL